LPFSDHKKTISTKPKGYTEQPKTIGEHLLKKRIDLKLTKVAIAKMIGVKPGRIQDWESGRCGPVDEHLKSVIDFIGYNPI